jgi:lysozyme
MKISDSGIKLVKRFEGFSSTPYQCSADVWTVGYGTTRISGKPVNKYMQPISREYAEELLMDDIAEFEKAVNELVKVPLEQNQFDALVSLTYNIGIGAFKKSTLLKKLNKGQYDQVPYELARWNKAGGKVLNGLVRRRAAEAELWSQSDTVDIPAHGKVERDVPSIINKENISAAGAVAGGVGAANLDGSNPISWALALIMVVGAAVFLYLFLRRRGA